MELDISRVIGVNIKKFRESIGFSRNELADKIGTSSSGLANYENGNRVPSVEVLVRLATALQVPIDLICGLNIEPITDSNIGVLDGFVNKDTGEVFENMIEYIRSKLKDNEDYDSFRRTLDELYNLADESKNEKIKKAIDKYINYAGSYETMSESAFRYIYLEKMYTPILKTLDIRIGPCLGKDNTTKIIIQDKKDGYEKEFSLEEAENFFNEIRFSIQSSIDRLKYYDKNNK